MKKTLFHQPTPFIRRESLHAPTGLTLICCCAGYGKTAYLSQLADEFPQSVCLSPSRGDDMKALLCEALPEAFIDPSDSVRETAFKAAAAIQNRDHCLLLVDNADAVSDSDILSRLIESAVRGELNAVLAARRLPGYLLPFVMEDSAILQGANEMRFSAEETASLAKLMNPALTDGELSRLYAFSSGWCIAVCELLRSYRGDEYAAADRSYLSEYIENTIIASLSADLRERFLQFAFLQEDEAFYRDGLHLSDMRAAICRLNRMGLVQHGEDGLFCPEVMRYLIAHLIPSKERNTLIEQASDYYVHNQRFAEAIRLFEVSGNSEAAERILRLYGDSLLKNCEFELIGYCGRIIGEAENVKSPEVLGALAQCDYYNGEYEKMERAFNRADSMFGKENKYSVLRMLYNGLLRYERNPALYKANVCSAVDWLKKHDEQLPFLYSTESELLERITTDKKATSDENRLYVRRFGGLRLTAGPDRVQINCKTKRSAELIAYMLEHGDRPVGRDELLDAFWHENMPANAVAMLHNMIYHLRRELSAYGLENIISYKSKYYMLDGRLFEIEDQRILDVCAASESGDAAALLPFDGLLRSYWGSFLGSIDSQWANEKREYYDRCYINACTALGEYYQEQDRCEDAVELLKNAYRLDPYSEQLVGELLHCYAALGKPDYARRCYEEYARKIDEEFGTRPGKWLRNRFFSCFAEEA